MPSPGWWKFGPAKPFCESGPPVIFGAGSELCVVESLTLFAPSEFLFNPYAAAALTMASAATSGTIRRRLFFESPLSPTVTPFSLFTLANHSGWFSVLAPLDSGLGESEL